MATGAGAAVRQALVSEVGSMVNRGLLSCTVHENGGEQFNFGDAAADSRRHITRFILALDSALSHGLKQSTSTRSLFTSSREKDYWDYILKASSNGSLSSSTPAVKKTIEGLTGQVTKLKRAPESSMGRGRAFSCRALC